jgi:hypothetical protein
MTTFYLIYSTVHTVQAQNVAGPRPWKEVELGGGGRLINPSGEIFVGEQTGICTAALFLVRFNFERFVPDPPPPHPTKGNP